MYSVIVGSSPQTGHEGSLRNLTSLNSVSSASKRSRRPTSGSPIPSRSLIVSFACSEPTMPGSTPSTPPSAQLGASSGGGGEEAAVAGARVGLEDRDLALEAVDGAVDDGRVVPDGRVVDEIPRGEVVRAVDDHVPAVGEDPLDVLGREPLLVGDDVDVGV